jgi:ADP-ribosylglycohydrolase
MQLVSSSTHEKHPCKAACSFLAALLLQLMHAAPTCAETFLAGTQTL